MNKKILLIILLATAFLIPGWRNAFCQGKIKALAWIPRELGITTETTAGTKKLFSQLTEEAFAPERVLSPLQEFKSSKGQVPEIKKRIAGTFDRVSVFTEEEKEIMKAGKYSISEGGDIAAVPLAKAFYLEQYSAQIMEELKKSFTLTPEQEKRFQEHQSRLQHFVADMEQGWAGRLGETTFKNFYVQSHFLNKEFRLNMLSEQSQEIVALLQSQKGDKGFFLISPEESEKFVHFSLQEQKRYAMFKYKEATSEVFAYFRKGPNNMSDWQFKQFYAWRHRAEYFKNLCWALQNATAPRTTIGIRFARPIPLSFGPFAGSRFLSDAQRIGKLQYYADHPFADVGKNLEVLAELKQQRELYNRYAFAQAFNVPYEKVPSMSENYFSSIKQVHAMFGEDAVNKIGGHDTENVIKELSAQIHFFNQEKANFVPKDESDFVEYYKLSQAKITYSVLLNDFLKR